MTIYVVVVVTYDYYRFQENAGAFTDLDKAMACAEGLAKERKYPVVRGAETLKMDKYDDNHIWIEEFENV